MINKLWKSIAILALFVLSAVAVSAATVPVTIDSLKLDGDTLLPDGTNRLSVERGDKVDVKVVFTATGDADNVEIKAFLSGSEHDKVSDETGVFDVKADTTYRKTLHLDLPERLDQDDYKLRVLVSDRDDESLEQNYNLRIDTARHAMKIRDVVFSPENEVKAGRSLITTVRVKNMGEKDEEDVKVTVSIPDLRISDSDFINDLKSDDSETTEELYMRVPNCAESGEYTAKITVTFDDGEDSVSEEHLLNVVADSSLCEPADESSRTLLTVGPESQGVKAGETANYVLTLTNEGSASKTYSVSADGLSGWAEASFSPGNVVVVEGGKTATVSVSVTPDKSADDEHMFTLTLSSAGEVLKQVPLKADVEGSDLGSVKKVLEVSLIVLVLLLVILGLVIGFKKMKSDDEEAGDEPQTYY